MSFQSNPPSFLSKKTSSQIFYKPIMSSSDPFSFSLNQPNHTTSTKIKVYSKYFSAFQLQIRDVQNCQQKRAPFHTIRLSFQFSFKVLTLLNFPSNPKLGKMSQQGSIQPRHRFQKPKPKGTIQLSYIQKNKKFYSTENCIFQVTNEKITASFMFLSKISSKVPFLKQPNTKLLNTINI